MAEFNLPEGWVTTTIGLISRVSSGVGFPIKYQGKPEGLYPVYKVGDVSKAVISKNGNLAIAGHYVDETEAKELKGEVFPIGATLFAKIGEAVKLNRRAFVIKPGLADNNVMAVIPYKADSNRFVYQFLRGVDLTETSRSTTVPSIRKGDIEEIELLLPPLAEQKVIADKLDTLLAQVDNTKARLERIPEILKRFRQSVLAAAVSGKLTKDFFCDSELEDDITEDWIAYQKKIFETIGKQPKSKNWMKSAPKPENRCEFADRLPAGKGWRIFFLDDIIFSKNQGVNTTTEKVEYTSSGIVAIQAGNIQEGYVHFQTDKFVSTEKFESLSAHVKPKSNDVLYTNIGANFGNAAVVPSEVDSFLITWNVMRIVPSRLIMPKYLEMVLNSKIIRDEALKAVSTSTVPFVNGKTIGQYVIPTPQIPEQVEIVRRVEELFAFADRIEHAAQAALGRVNNLTQSILTKAFRGELTADWRAANPDLISGENSAEALLARIKAERAKVKARKKA